MDISVSGAAATGVKTGTLVVGAFADGTLTRAAEAVDQAAGGALSAALKRGDLEEKAGSTLLFPALAGVAADRVLLVSFGARTALGDRSYRDALSGAGRALAAGAAADAAVALVEVDVPNRSLAWRVQTAARLLADAAYKFDAPRAKPPAARGAGKAVLLVSGAADGLDAAARTGIAIADGMALTKDLGNLGGNVCNPAYMADTAVALGKEFGFEVEILERADMEKLGMHSALSVGRASYPPCKFIVMKYSRAARLQADRAGRQGHDLRHRRRVAEARRQPRRDEVRHVRRRDGARRLPHRRAARPADQSHRRSCWRSRTCPAATPAGRATSSARWRASRSRS